MYLSKETYSELFKIVWYTNKQINEDLKFYVFSSMKNK